MGKPEETFTVYASDVSGQMTAEATDIADASVGELVQGLLAEMKLPRNDAGGRPLVYAARLDREGRALNANERVAEALQPGDKITLQPNIDAGATLA